MTRGSLRRESRTIVLIFVKDMECYDLQTIDLKRDQSLSIRIQVTTGKKNDCGTSYDHQSLLYKIEIQIYESVCRTNNFPSSKFGGYILFDKSMQQRTQKWVSLLAESELFCAKCTKMLKGTIPGVPMSKSAYKSF